MQVSLIVGVALLNQHMPSTERRSFQKGIVVSSKHAVSAME